MLYFSYSKERGSQMKDIYDKIVEIKIEGVSKDWEKTSSWSHCVLRNEKEVKEQTQEFRLL